MNNKRKLYNKKYYAKTRDKQIANKKVYRVNNKERLQRFERTPKRRFRIYKENAKNRGLIFNIDFKDFLALVNSRCFYCGQEGYGIDREDPMVGYIYSNIVPCCIMCNRMKWDFTKEEFIEKCKLIIKYNS